MAGIKRRYSTVLNLLVSYNLYIYIYIYTWFIWHNFFLIHDEVKLEMCSSYDKIEPNIVPDLWPTLYGS
jgi:hypothetical protein